MKRYDAVSKSKRSFFTKRVFVTAIAVGLMVTTALLFNVMLREAGASGIAGSIIVELNGDPAAVWKARTESQGGTVSAEQLQNYRNSIKSSQDQFLAALSARDISYEIDGIDVPNYDGSTQAEQIFVSIWCSTASRSRCRRAAIATIKTMPQVKAVHNNDFLRIQLDKSVDYVNAPANYGQVPELTPFDNHREGFEGQGINISVIDTGIDWSHPMFGGDRDSAPARTFATDGRDELQSKSDLLSAA